MDRREFLGLAIPAGIGVGIGAGTVGLSGEISSGPRGEIDRANVFGEDPKAKWTGSSDSGDLIPPELGGITGDGERVYLPTFRGVHALDATDGSEAWTFETLGEVQSTPNVVGDAIFCGSSGGRVYAIEAASGAERWDVFVESSVRGSPVVDDGIAFVATEDGELYGLDAETGKRVWRSEAGPELADTPSTDGNSVYAVSFDGDVYAFDAATGDPRWQTDVANEQGIPRVAIHDGTVFASFGNSLLFGYEAETGRKRLELDMGDRPLYSFTPYDGVVYVSTWDGLAAVDVERGERKWTETLRGNTRAPPVVVDGSQLDGPKGRNRPLVLWSTSWAMYALADDRSGAPLPRSVLPLDEFEFFHGGRLAFVDGTLYAADGDGPVSAFDVPITGSAQDARHSKFQSATD
jgi:outer membrane protein assembly factor BamB